MPNLLTLFQRFLTSLTPAAPPTSGAAPAGPAPGGALQALQNGLTNWDANNPLEGPNAVSFNDRGWSGTNGTLYNQATGNAPRAGSNLGWVPATMAGAAMAGLSLLPGQLSQHGVSGAQGLFTSPTAIAIQAQEVEFGLGDVKLTEAAGGSGTTANGWDATWDKVWRDASGNAIKYEGLKWTKDGRTITADNYSNLANDERGWGGVRYGENEAVDRIRGWDQDGRQVFAGTSGFAAGFGGHNSGLDQTISEQDNFLGRQDSPEEMGRIDGWAPVNQNSDFDSTIPRFQEFDEPAPQQQTPVPDAGEVPVQQAIYRPPPGSGGPEVTAI